MECLVGVLPKATTSGREKIKFESTSKRPVNILNAVKRSSRSCYVGIIWKAFSRASILAITVFIDAG